MSVVHLAQITVKVACTCMHLGFFVLGFFFMCFWGFFRMGNKGKHVSLMGWRKNWTSFLARKCEWSAVTKTQSKTGVKTETCKLHLWQEVDHGMLTWHITKGRQGISMGQEFLCLPKFPVQPHDHAWSMLQRVLVYNPEHGRGEAWAPVTL